MAAGTPLTGITLAAASVADDLGYVALTDLAQALGGLTEDYRVIGGHMVTILAARWQLGHELYRETCDVDLGIPPIVVRGSRSRERRVISLNAMQPRLSYEIYSIPCYNLDVPGRGDLLREVMRETRTTQSALSRLSGVRQPSISQFLSGTVDLSDDQLDRLLSCMGYRLEVTRRPVVPELTRSERRSWRLHCRLSIRLTPASLEEWRPVIERNLKRLRSGVTGQPHSRNLDRWESLVGHGDVLGLHRVLTGLDRDSIEMREVSPMGGLLPQDERQAALQEAG